MEGDCLRIKSNWLRMSIGRLLRKIISKNLGIDLTELCISDLDVSSTTNDEYMQVHLDVSAIISKKDVMNLIGGNNDNNA